MQWLIRLALIFSLAVGPETGYAQSLFVSALPEPGTMLSVSPAFVPVLVKGLVVHPDKPLNFEFIVDSGNDSSDQALIKSESDRIAKYFLAAVTVPEDQLWVNLSPFEKDRIIENDLGSTVLGRDMLAQDYVLKQLTASMIYPEQGLGKEFWARVYKAAQEKFGTTDIPVDTFNKVWIMPGKAEVYEKGNAVYVTEAKLKVMLDSDRNASATVDEKSQLTKEVLREVVLPAIEKEVNEGKSFAVIRQVYNAAILAKWYRELIANTLLADAYAGKNLVAGVTSDEKQLKEEIYQRYIAAYKKGVFNLIKEEPDPVSGEAIPKKYFSGGENLRIEKLDRAESIGKAGEAVGKVFDVSLAIKDQGESDQVKTVLGLFGITEFSSAEKLLGGNGSVFRPVKFRLPSGESYVLRQEKKTIEQVRFIVSVINKLRAMGLPAPKLFSAVNDPETDDFFVEHDGAFYLVEEFLQNGVTVRAANLEDRHFTEMGSLAARINNALEGFKPEGKKSYKTREQIFGELKKYLAEAAESHRINDPVLLEAFRSNDGFFFSQFEAFRKEYDPAKLRDGIIFADLHAGNLKFNNSGKAVGLLDFDFTGTDKRVVEFNNMVMGNDDPRTKNLYTYEKFLAMVRAYNREAAVRLSIDEIRGAIGVVRLRLLEDISSRFIDNGRWGAFNSLPLEDRRQMALHSLAQLKKFSDDFGTEDKILAFAREANRDSAQLWDQYKEELRAKPAPDVVGRMAVSIGEEQGRRYKEAVMSLVGNTSDRRVTPAILWEAAGMALKEEDLSKAEGSIALQPGSMNPFTNGHLSMSLAGILSAGLDGAVIANGGLTPEKPYALSAKLRRWLTHLVVEDMSPWVRVSSVRDDIFQAFKDEDQRVWGEDRGKQVLTMDLAGFIWLFRANPKVQWVYLAGSDKVEGYYGKKEGGFIKDILHDKVGAKVLYFLRQDETSPALQAKVRGTWVEELWDRGFFEQSKRGTPKDINATMIRSRISLGQDPGDEVSQALKNFLTAHPEIGRLYQLESTIKEIENKIEVALKNADQEEIAGRYKEWLQAIAELKSIAPIEVNGQQVPTYQAVLLDDKARQMKAKVDKAQTTLSDHQIDWLIRRVEAIHKVNVSADLRLKIREELLKKNPTDFLTKIPLTALSSADQEIFRLVESESAVFHNGTFDTDGFLVGVAVDKDAEKKMKSARSKFYKKLGELKELSRQYWQEELPRYRGAVESFNDDKRQGEPKVSIGIISLFDRRFDSLIRRLDELSTMENKGKTELVINIVLVNTPIANNDRQHCDQANWLKMVKKINSSGIPTRIVFTKKNTITTNRNIAASLSSGEYQVFIDDDINLVGPVVEKMIAALESHPEFGMVSVAAYSPVSKDGKIVGKELYKPRFMMKRFIDDRYSMAVTNLVLGMATATRRDILQVSPFLRFLKTLGDDIHYLRQVQMMGFLGGYVLDNDAYVIDEQVGTAGASATKGQVNLHPYLIEEGVAYYLNQTMYSEYEHRRAVFKVKTFTRGLLTREGAEKMWRTFSAALLDFLNGKTRGIRMDINAKGYDKEIRRQLAGVIRDFRRIKNELIEYKKNEYDKRNLAGVSTNFGMLRYTDDPPKYIYLNKKIFEGLADSYEVELSGMFAKSLQLKDDGRDLFSAQEAADRKARYMRAFEIETQVKAMLKILRPGRSADIDIVRERLARLQWQAKRLSKESALATIAEPLKVVPFDQLSRFGGGDTSANNHHVGLSAGMYLTDGLALSEAQNPKAYRQNNHLHGTQEMTVALSGDIRIARIGIDGKDIDYLPVPAGSMIKVAQNTLHRIDNPDKDHVSADFTIKAPLVQLQKSFEYSEAGSPEGIRVIPPSVAELDHGRGRVLTHYYPAMDHRLDIDPQTQELVLDGNGLPTAGGDAYVKVRVVHLRPGQESDRFDMNPVYSGFQAIRVFPWPENISPEWSLERDRRGLTGHIDVFDRDSKPVRSGDFMGGDLVVIKNGTGMANDTAGFQIRNTSAENTLIFAVVEQMAVEERLSPEFLRTLTVSERVHNLATLPVDILTQHASIVSLELDAIETEVRASAAKLKGPAHHAYLEGLSGEAKTLATRLAGAEAALRDKAREVSGAISSLADSSMSGVINKENYFLAVFIDPDLMSAVVKAVPLVRKFSQAYIARNGRVPTMDEIKDYVQSDKDVLEATGGRKIEQVPDMMLLSGVELNDGARERITLAKAMLGQLMSAPVDRLDDAVWKLREPANRRAAIITLKWLANTADLDEAGYRAERDQARVVLKKFTEMFFGDFQGKKMLDAFSGLVSRKIDEKLKQGATPDEILVVPMLTSGEQIGRYVGAKIAGSGVKAQPLLFTTAMTIAFGRENKEKSFRANMFTPEGKENALRYLRQEGVLNGRIKHLIFIDTGMTGSFGKLLKFALEDRGVSADLLLVAHDDYQKVGIEKEWAYGLNDEEGWSDKSKDLRWMCIMLDHVFEHSEESPSHQIEGLDGGAFKMQRRPTNHPWFLEFVNREFDRQAKQALKTHDVRIDLGRRLRESVGGNNRVTVAGSSVIEVVAGHVDKGTVIRDIFASSPGLKRAVYFGNEFLIRNEEDGNDLSVLPEAARLAAAGKEMTVFSVDEDPQARTPEAQKNTIWLGAGVSAVRGFLAQLRAAVEKGEKQMIVRGVGMDSGKAAVISLKNIGFYFDIDGTTTDGPGGFSYEPGEIGAAFVDLLAKGVPIGLISWAPRLGKNVSTLNPLRAQVLYKQDLQNFVFYGNGSATKVTYGADGEPSVSQLAPPIPVEDIEKVASVIKKSAADHFGLSPDELAAWKRWFNYSDALGYGSLPGVKGARFHFLSVDGKTEPSVLTIEKALQASEEKPLDLTIPFIEVRDGVQLYIKFLPKEVDMSMSDLGDKAQDGGIDIQNIDVTRKLGASGIRFNDDALRAVLTSGFNGFTPVILNIEPVADLGGFINKGAIVSAP